MQLYQKDSLVEDGWCVVSGEEYFALYQKLVDEKRAEDKEKKSWFCLLPSTLDAGQKNYELICRVGGLFFEFHGLVTSREIRPDLVRGDAVAILSRKEGQEEDMSRFSLFDLEGWVRDNAAKEITEEEFNNKLKEYQS